MSGRLFDASNDGNFREVMNDMIGVAPLTHLRPERPVRNATGRNAGIVAGKDVSFGVAHGHGFSPVPALAIDNEIQYIRIWLEDAVIASL
jgi:hypothetical protein